MNYTTFNRALPSLDSKDMKNTIKTNVGMNLGSDCNCDFKIKLNMTDPVNPCVEEEEENKIELKVVVRNFWTSKYVENAVVHIDAMNEIETCPDLKAYHEQKHALTG